MKFKEKLNQAAGFTLVELIVVIAILAILAGIAVPVYSGYIEKANLAADQQLLAAVNKAFAAACAENGTDNYAQPNGSVRFDMENMTVDKFTDAFDDYFKGNETPAFKVYTGLTFVNGLFVDNATALGIYAALLGTFDADDIANLKDSTFGTMGVANLLGGVDMAALVAAGLLGGEDPDDRVGALLYSGSNWSTIASILGCTGVDDPNFGGAYNALLSKKMEMMKQDPLYADIANDEEKLKEAARHAILANSAVLSVAKSEQFDANAFAAELTAGTAKDTIKGNLAANGDLSAGLSQAAMTYALYLSYAEKNNIPFTEDAALEDVLDALSDPKFQEYVTSPEGLKDIAGYKAGLNMADSANNNMDAAYDILLNGYSTDEMENLLNGSLG